MNQSHRNSPSDLSYRRELIKQHPHIHGVEYLSIVAGNQLQVHFIQPEFHLKASKPLPEFTPDKLIVEVLNGGDVRQVDYHLQTMPEDYCLLLHLQTDLDTEPDSNVRVSLDASNVDSFFNSVQLIWKPQEQTQEQELLGSEHSSKPDFQSHNRLDYLAKDYDSFCKLIESELSHCVPGWQEKDPADMVVAINEVLAYAGDMLSYKQDVVGTEAYLSTSRFELSLRRHCRLLDYYPQNNCTARTWVAIKVDGTVKVPAGTPFFCGGDGAANSVLTLGEYQSRTGGKEVVFEAIGDTLCDIPFNTMALYDFGIADFALEPGATSAIIKGHVFLKYGQLMAFTDSLKNTATQIVRLTGDAIHKQDPLSGEYFTFVNWHHEDALRDVWSAANAVLTGNIVLVDRGETRPWQAIELLYSNDIFRAELPKMDVKKAAPIDVAGLRHRSAQSAMAQDAAQSRAMIEILETPRKLSDGQRHKLGSSPENQLWSVVTDFLDSTPGSRHAVLDEHQGSAQLRFGNGTFGAVPNQFNHYYVRMRISPLQDYKVSTGMINQLCFPQHEDIATELIASVHSLTPAMDTIVNKSMAQVKQEAAFAHHGRVNLVSPQDYVDFLCAQEDIRNVSYCDIWSGSHQVFQFFIYPQTDIFSQRRLARLDEEITRHKVINQHFMLGVFSPLLLHIDFSVKPKRGTSKQALYARLQQCLSDDPEQGFFSRAHFDFGTAYHQSQLLQGLLSMDGVASVTINAFQSLDQYVGSNQQNQQVEAIIPEPHQVICFRYQERKSMMKVSFVEAAFVEVSDV